LLDLAKRFIAALLAHAAAQFLGYRSLHGGEK
jgi:hypothetical protein